MNSSTNKRILWDILKDNNVFENMKNSQYKEVKDTFDNVVEVTCRNLEVDRTKSNYSTIQKNKLIIEQLIPAIESIRNNTNTTTNQLSHNTPTMQVVYDSENVHLSHEQVQMGVNKIGNDSFLSNQNHNLYQSQNQNQNHLFHVKKSEQEIGRAHV